MIVSKNLPKGYQNGYYHVVVAPKDARFKPDILCTTHTTISHQNPKLTIQFKQFTHCYDRFAVEALDRKIKKYQPLVYSIARRWIVAPRMVVGTRTTTHIPSMKSLDAILKLSTTKIMSIFKQINIIVTQYAHIFSILVHE